MCNGCGHRTWMGLQQLQNVDKRWGVIVQWQDMATQSRWLHHGTWMGGFTDRDKLEKAETNHWYQTIINYTLFFFKYGTTVTSFRHLHLMLLTQTALVGYTSLAVNPGVTYLDYAVWRLLQWRSRWHSRLKEHRLSSPHGRTSWVCWFCRGMSHCKLIGPRAWRLLVRVEGEEWVSEGAGLERGEIRMKGKQGVGSGGGGYKRIIHCLRKLLPCIWTKKKGVNQNWHAHAHTKT